MPNETREDSPPAIVRALIERMKVQHEATVRMLNTMADLLEALLRERSNADGKRD
jgi:hypothetical protein